MLTSNTTFITGDYQVKSFDDLNAKSVLGHTGKVNRIVNCQNRWVEDVEVFRARGKFDGLLCETTGEHPCRVAKVKIRRKRYDYKKHQAFPRCYEVAAHYWKNAREVKRGIYLCIPKAKFSYDRDSYKVSELVQDWPHQVVDGQILGLQKDGGINGSAKAFPITLPVRADLYWFLGLYIAEGSCFRSAVYFSLHEDETDIIERLCRIGQEIFGKEATVRSLKGGKGINVYFGSKALREFIKVIVPGNTCAKTKQVRYDLLSPRHLTSLLEGIWQGDGTTDKKGGTQKRISTAVPSLAFLYFQVAAHCGLHPNLKKHRQQSQMNSDHIYVVNWSVNETKRNIDKLVDGSECWWCKVKQVDVRSYTGIVYNMETGLDHSYMAGMVGMHNCKSF